MNRPTLPLALCLCVSGLSGSACQRTGPAAADPAALVERGRHLAAIMGCGDCHTPLKMGPNGPEPDTSMLLAGHPQSLEVPPPPAPSGPWGVAATMTLTAWSGPWGVSYASNLTPDEETGIGAWDENLFARAMRSGKHMGAGRPILPPMPWQNVAALTGEDLGALWAYLQSIPPVKNKVPPAVPASAPAGGTGG